MCVTKKELLLTSEGLNHRLYSILTEVVLKMNV